MRTPRIACALLCCLALTTLGKEEAPPGEILWELTVDGPVLATAATDGRHIYFGTTSTSAQETESTFYCRTLANGGAVWSRRFPNWLLACPVVTASRVFVGCDDSRLYCLDKASGEELWNFATAGRVDSTPCVDTPGNSYFGSRDRFFYCLDPDGSLRWARFLQGPIASSPILDERESRVYVADLTNTIYAFALTGELVWSYKPRLGDITGLRLRIYSSPALDDEGYLYVGSGDHHLYAIDRSTGFLFWREDTGSIVDASPVISADEFLYVANRDGVLYSYNIEPFSDAREVWSNDAIGQVFYGSPTIDAANNIYICGAPPLADPKAEEAQTQLSYIDRNTGDIIWSQTIAGYTDATPILDAEGNVYFGTAGGKFVKISGAGIPLADTAWPTFHGGHAGHGRHEETFSRWLARNGIPPELASSDRDSDGDGFRDYEEFVFGTDPKDARERPERASDSFRTTSSNTVLSFSLQKGIRAPYEIQFGTDLRSWLPFSVPPPQLQFEDRGTTWQIEAALESPADSPAAFYRVKWER